MAAFYLDEDVSARIAEFLRRVGHVATTAYDTGSAAATDDEHFLIAVQNDAILVTCNFNDYKLLHSAWRRWTGYWGIAEPHRGILVIPQQRWFADEAVEHIAELIDLHGEDLKNRMFRWRPSTGWYKIG